MRLLRPLPGNPATETPAPASEWAIEADGLCRGYGDKLALDHLDLRLPHGGIHAFVGANGAGKSTFFRVLLGFLSPSAGSARILGHDCRALPPELRGRIGFVNEEHTLPGWMTVRALAAMQRAHYPGFDDSILKRALEHYELRQKQTVAQLSRGERAGLNLGLALAQRPELLILDEPTLGLDVVAKRAFLEALLQGRDPGTAGGAGARATTVVYCSHQMEEIERVADNLILLERGRVRAASSPEELCARVRLWIAEIPFRGPDPASVPGLLEWQRIDGLDHYLVLDQGQQFGSFLRGAGALSVNVMEVGLDRAVNGFLARNHAAPAA
jgi:ABC-2 type transport system ATP-binding protein